MFALSADARAVVEEEIASQQVSKSSVEWNMLQHVCAISSEFIRGVVGGIAWEP
jgi:hypothetical protein